MLGFLSWNPDISSNFLLLAQQTCDGDRSTSFQLRGCTPKRGRGPPLLLRLRSHVRGTERGWHLSPGAFGRSLSCAVSSSLPASEVCGVLSGLPQAAQPPGLARWQTS